MSKPTFSKEGSLWNSGYRYVAGIDEVGRGAWAGPIVAAGVIFDKRVSVKGLKDSKQLTPKKREELVDIIKAKAVAWTIQEISNTEIDEIGVGKANTLVIEKVVAALRPIPDYLLIDKASVNPQALSMKWETIIRGDNKVVSIAAASVLAKVARDAMMVDFARDYPEYQFENHKGYGTKAHQQALATHSFCTLHRQSYKPIAQIKNN